MNNQIDIQKYKSNDNLLSYFGMIQDLLSQSH